MQEAYHFSPFLSRSLLRLLSFSLPLYLHLLRFPSSRSLSISRIFIILVGQTPRRVFYRAFSSQFDYYIINPNSISPPCAKRCSRKNVVVHLSMKLILYALLRRSYEILINR